MKKAEQFLNRVNKLTSRKDEVVVATQLGDVTTQMIADAFKEVFQSHSVKVTAVDAAISVTDASIFLRLTIDESDCVLQFFVDPDEGLCVRKVGNTDEEIPEIICLDNFDPAVDNALSSVDIKDLSWITKSVAKLLTKPYQAHEAYMTMRSSEPEAPDFKKSVNQGILTNDNGHFKKTPVFKKRSAIDRSDVDAFTVIKSLGWRDFKNA